MANSDSVPNPLFIVGPSRSGTELIRSILNNHPDIFVTGETHYFDDLREEFSDSAQSCLSPEKARRCEDYFRALSHRPYGHAGDPTKGWLTVEDLRAERQACGEGSDAYFEAYCRLNAKRSGRQYWGEKTPRHIYRIPDILSRYPGARIICMVRDPRAICASYRDWTNQGGFDFEKDCLHRQALQNEQIRARSSYHIVIHCVLWRGVVNAAFGAQNRFGRKVVYLQRYEDLVGDTKNAGQSIMNWLGLELDERLLDVPMHNSSFSSFSKNTGVAKEPVHRWREKLSDSEIAVIQDCCGNIMNLLGYKCEMTKFSLSRTIPWITLPYAVISAARANKDRIGNVPRYILRRLQLSAFGNVSRKH